MYFLDGPIVCQLFICQNPTRKCHVLPRLSTCMQTVYMSEAQQEMICIVWMVHLSAICPYVRILTGNDMYCLHGTLVCQLSICHTPNSK